MRIDPVYRGPFANEYGDEILDYSKVKSPLTNRFIPPYVTSKTHGANVHDGMIELINICRIYENLHSVLDLGCGAGELLSKLDVEDKHGMTIHVGEVEYANKVYGLPNVIAGDMRKVDEYYPNKKFDCVILHCSLQFISPEERTTLVNITIPKVLSEEGYLIIVNYKGNPVTDVNNVDCVNCYVDCTRMLKPSDNFMGDLRVLVKK